MAAATTRATPRAASSRTKRRRARSARSRDARAPRGTATSRSGAARRGARRARGRPRGRASSRPARAHHRAAARRRTRLRRSRRRWPWSLLLARRSVRYFDAHVHLHPPRLAAAIEQWFARETGTTPTPSSRRRWPRRCAPAASSASASSRTRTGRAWRAPSTSGWRRRPPAIRRRWPWHPARRRPRPRGHRPRCHRRTGPARLQVSLLRPALRRRRSRLFPVYERAEAEGLCFAPRGDHAVPRSLHRSGEGFARVMARFPRLRVCVAHWAPSTRDGFLALAERIRTSTSTPPWP